MGKALIDNDLLDKIEAAKLVAFVNPLGDYPMYLTPIVQTKDNQYFAVYGAYDELDNLYGREVVKLDPNYIESDENDIVWLKEEYKFFNALEHFLFGYAEDDFFYYQDNKQEYVYQDLFLHDPKFDELMKNKPFGRMSLSRNTKDFTIIKRELENVIAHMKENDFYSCISDKYELELLELNQVLIKLENIKGD